MIIINVFQLYLFLNILHVYIVPKEEEEEYFYNFRWICDPQCFQMKELHTKIWQLICGPVVIITVIDILECFFFNKSSLNVYLFTLLFVLTYS